MDRDRKREEERGRERERDVVIDVSSFCTVEVFHNIVSTATLMYVNSNQEIG